MRVVAGSARGRRVDAPAGSSTRPTSDRVRESIFNALGSLDVLVGARVVDLFAGSGAMGIEALSRGAVAATFVESDRSAVACIRANLDRCGFTEVATVVPSTVERWIAGAARGRAVDLVLADPPYAFDGWPELLAAVPGEWIVVESDRAIEIPEPWHVVRERVYGSTVVQIAARTPPESSSSPQEQMQ